MAAVTLGVTTGTGDLWWDLRKMDVRVIHIQPPVLLTFEGSEERVIIQARGGDVRAIAIQPTSTSDL